MYKCTCTFTYNCVLFIQKPFGEMVQVRPQKLTLQLRAGDPQEFTLQFQPAENFPLDVYFLLDVTGSFARSFTDTVTPLATELGADNYMHTFTCTCLPSALFNYLSDLF